jgi:heat shock protein HslJ
MALPGPPRRFEMKKIFSFSMVLLFISGLMLVSLGGCKKSAEYSIDDLIDFTWVLQEFHYSDQLIIAAEQTFTIVFRSDDTVEMKVDCNNCFGNYSAVRGTLSFLDSFACTEAHCGNESQDQRFMVVMNNVSRYEITGNTLKIYFFFTDGEGYMVFNK